MHVLWLTEADQAVLPDVLLHGFSLRALEYIARVCSPSTFATLNSRSVGQCEHAVRTQVQFNSVSSVHFGEVCSGHGTDANEATRVNEQIRNLSWMIGPVEIAECEHRPAAQWGGGGGGGGGGGRGGGNRG